MNYLCEEVEIVILSCIFPPPPPPPQKLLSNSVQIQVIRLQECLSKLKRSNDGSLPQVSEKVGDFGEK